MRLSYLSVMPLASYEPGYVEGANLCKVSVQYSIPSGADVKLNLGPDFAKRILALIADELVKGSQEVARNLTAEIINGTAALQAPDSASDDKVIQ